MEQQNANAPRGRRSLKGSVSRKGWVRRLLGDAFFVVRRDRKWWVVPLLIVLLILTALFFIAAVSGPLAPFLYPLL
jgi:hypothetical protein